MAKFIIALSTCSAKFDVLVKITNLLNLFKIFIAKIKNKGTDNYKGIIQQFKGNN